MEPVEFKALFPCWRESMCEEARNASSIPASKTARVSFTDALRPFKKSSYTLEELTARERPEGVDVLKLEAYLSDEDFEVSHTPSREPPGAPESN
jgi:hypothetical protein